MPRRPTLTVAITLIALACAFAAGQRSVAKDASAPPPPRLYELRIYTAAPGKMDALQKRFRDVTLRMFEKHGITNIAYWTGTDGPQKEKLYYVVAYPTAADREKMLINGIAQDAEFLKAVAESEKEGKLTTGTESILLSPTDFSPLK